MSKAKGNRHPAEEKIKVALRRSKACSNYLANGLVITLLFLSASLALAQGTFSGKVVGILDGDTIQVMHQGAPEKVRLEGIDCPESGQAFGTKAKQFTSELVGGEVVTVEVRSTDRSSKPLRGRDSVKSAACF